MVAGRPCTCMTLATKGEVIQIKTLISHKMETGQRKDKAGKKIPRKIINKFVATYNGAEIFNADWHPSIAANPYLAFYTVATESGTLKFTWTDDDGSIYSTSSKITVN